MFSLKGKKQLHVLEDLAREESVSWRAAKLNNIVTSDYVNQKKSTSKLAQLLIYAALPLSSTMFLVLSGISGVVTAVAVSQFLSAKLIPIYLGIGASCPLLYVEKRIKDRANKFTEDYATMLMASASSIKVGLTAYHALERSVNMLSKDSLVKHEVNILLKKLKEGESRELAISSFGNSIRLPDIELFRSAFTLVLDNGGRFAPTLSRLASVSYGRLSLIRSARVSTANMRMTANFLLLAVPVLLLMMSVKTPNYWNILFNDPQANTFGSIGIIMILGSYSVLRQFSNFKP